MDNLAVQTKPPVQVGLLDADSYALARSVARDLSASNIVPQRYQNAPANCLIALNMANRIGADPLMVMQNLYVVHGTPSWSAQFLIAAFNSTPGFSKLRYEFEGEVGTDEWSCRAWAIEKDTETRLDGAWVSIALAKKEGWYGKNGSKWLTMPQQMLMYRAASWFVRAYAPEIAMGLQTAEEVRDTYDLEPAVNGSYAITGEASAADSTADILSRAKGEASGNENCEDQAESSKRNRPTKEEMEARRAEAVAAVESAGLSLEDVEKTVNAFAKDWTTAQCQRVIKMASESKALPAQEAESEALACPMSGNVVRLAVECQACGEFGKCPETDKQ